MSAVTLPRGYKGILPRTTKLADESYLDFVETFRGIAGYGTYPLVAQVGDHAVHEQLGDTDDTTPIEDIKRVINALPLPTWKRRMWSGLSWRVRVYEPDACSKASFPAASGGFPRLSIPPQPNQPATATR